MSFSQYTLTVTCVREETSEYLSIFFTKPEGFSYEPADCFDIFFLDAPDDKRTFSFASSPTEKEIQISYRKGRSIFKKRLENLRIGDSVAIRYFGGTFHVDTKKNALFIAGGIGITTFRSMVKWIMDKNVSKKIDILYVNRDGDFPFQKEFEGWKYENRMISITYWNSTEKGRLTKTSFDSYIAAIQNSTLIPYISGPPAMVDSVVSLLRSSEVKRSLIQTDSFDGYEEDISPPTKNFQLSTINNIFIKGELIEIFNRNNLLPITNN